jgi:aminopeptidase YwaD
MLTEMSKQMSIKKSALLTLIAGILITLCQSLYAQYPPNYQYTLLPSKVIDELIGAASGDLAMSHIIRLAGYNRPRNDNEYTEFPRETHYIIDKLKEYGIRDFTIEKFGKEKSWRGIEGSLWEISPGIAKIADFEDIPDMLAEGSETTDVTAQLIWAGDGLASFFEDNNAVKGKIVLTSGSLRQVHNRAMKAGALGTVTYYSPGALKDPLQIPNSSIDGTGFAFALPPREAQYLRDRLLRGENITVRAKISSKTEEFENHVPQCVIKGTDTTAGEVLFTAHLYEGLVKSGANDNASGASVILEVAHLLNDLITEGKISKPARNIRFLWVPEFSGTIPWVNSHPELARRAICDINLDMVGLRLRDSKSFMYLYRSGYSDNSFINDVMECYYRYVGETNSEGITDQLGRRGFTKRIVSPTGSDDPFYYKITSLHGSSDNAVFNDWSIGVAGVKMGTWPDNYYHTSEDTPEKCDATQLRRIIFISAASAYTVASPGEENAVRILSEMFSGASARFGIQMGKASDMICNADAKTMADAYKRAVYNLEGFTMAEKAAMEKVVVLSPTQYVQTLISNRKESLDNLLQVQLSALHELMDTRSRELSIQPALLNLNETEKSAARIIPAPTGKARTMVYEGYVDLIKGLPQTFMSSNSFDNVSNISEAAGLADGKRNMLQIKKMIDSEFERESPIQEIMNYFNVLKEAGLMKW